MSKKKQAPKRRGRPPISEGEVRRHFVNTRTTSDIKERIDGAAKKSGRSVSQEVEFRIERSFLLEDFLGAVMGENKLVKLAIDLSQAATLIRDHYGESVWEDAEASYAFLMAAQFLMNTPFYGPPKESIDDFKKRQTSFKSREAERKEAHWNKLRKETGSTLMGPSVPPPPEGERLSPFVMADLLGEAVGTVVAGGHLRELKQAISEAEKSALAEEVKSAEDKDGA